MCSIFLNQNSPPKCKRLGSFPLQSEVYPRRCAGEQVQCGMMGAESSVFSRVFCWRLVKARRKRFGLERRVANNDVRSRVRTSVQDDT